MKTKAQSGFAVVEGILIFAIIMIIAGTCYYVWHANNQEDTVSVGTPKSSSTTTKSIVTSFEECKNAAGSKIQTSYPEVCVTKDSKSFTNKSVSTDQKYLVIKEWSIKVPLSVDIEDATYAAMDGITDKSNNLGLGTESLTALDPECAPNKNGVGIISRQTIQTHDANKSAGAGLGASVYSTKIGSYYYEYIHSQAACSNNSTTNQKQISYFSVFAKAFENLMAAE